MFILIELDFVENSKLSSYVTSVGLIDVTIKYRRCDLDDCAVYVSVVIWSSSLVTNCPDHHDDGAVILSTASTYQMYFVI